MFHDRVCPGRMQGDYTSFCMAISRSSSVSEMASSHMLKSLSSAAAMVVTCDDVDVDR